MSGLTRPQWTPTRQQVRILDFIRTYRLESPERLSPTLEEIATGVGIRSKSNIAHHVAELARHGLITHTRYRRRSLRLPPFHSVDIEFPADVHAELLSLARRADRSPDSVILDLVTAYIRERAPSPPIAPHRAGAPRAAPQTRVYFAHFEALGRLKIGISANVGARLNDISQAIGCDVILLGEFIGDLEDEARAHTAFSLWNVRGEWFSF
jgi:hypothetical protein